MVIVNRKALFALIAEKQLTLKAAAALAGVSVGTVYRYINEERNAHSEIIGKLAGALGVEPSYILTDKKEEPKPQGNKTMTDFLCVLSKRERDVLAMRIGDDQNEPKTLAEIGKKYGITRERVRQIERRALVILRRCVKNQNDDLLKLKLEARKKRMDARS